MYCQICNKTLDASFNVCISKGATEVPGNFGMPLSSVSNSYGYPVDSLPGFTWSEMLPLGPPSVLFDNCSELLSPSFLPVVV